MAVNKKEEGRAGTAALLWLLGIPIPIVILVLLMGGC